MAGLVYYTPECVVGLLLATLGPGSDRGVQSPSGSDWVPSPSRGSLHPWQSAVWEMGGLRGVRGLLGLTSPGHPLDRLLWLQHRGLTGTVGAPGPACVPASGPGCSACVCAGV